MKKIINRKALFNYEFLEKQEAGILLTGAEVKSIKMGRINLAESFVKIRGGELWLFNAHIAAYQPAADKDYEPTRTRKLLLHKKQIDQLARRIDQKGLTIVPVSCYTANHKVKLGIALAKGKREYEKKEKIKKRDIQRDIERELRGKN
ncbi:MAG: SsrA-binding protein SmpB [Patescibacteria group bacterium]|nr:SsrA-binding protein SmpB [Patescibacteria group bacterium]